MIEQEERIEVVEPSARNASAKADPGPLRDELRLDHILDNSDMHARFSLPGWRNRISRDTLPDAWVVAVDDGAAPDVSRFGPKAMISRVSIRERQALDFVLFGILLYPGNSMPVIK
jgi:hypothetical protein